MISFLPVDHYPDQSCEVDNSVDLQEFFCERFDKENCILFPSGSAAINSFLETLCLEKGDEIWITTTFDYPNVSSCVTSTIFNHCKPSRVLTNRTKAIFVIHEFGVPHPDLIELRGIARERHIPLVENCAHTIDSWCDKKLVGAIGDWTILSFPKIFPVKTGGALLGPAITFQPTKIEQQKINKLQADLPSHLTKIAEYSQSRRDVFRELTAFVKTLGIEPVFEVTSLIAPWFFPIRTSRWEEYLEIAPDKGIDCAVWHGTDIVVLPCHQFIGSYEKEAIRELIKKIETGTFKQKNSQHKGYVKI